jgi:hypothetical protein
LEAVVIPQRRGVPEHTDDDDGEHSPGNRQHPARQASCCRSCVTTRTPAFARGVPLAGSRRPRSRPGLPRAVAGQRDARRLPWLRRQRQHPFDGLISFGSDCRLDGSRSAPRTCGFCP